MVVRDDGSDKLLEVCVEQDIVPCQRDHTVETSVTSGIDNIQVIKL